MQFMKQVLPRLISPRKPGKKIKSQLRIFKMVKFFFKKQILSFLSFSSFSQ